MQKNIEVLANFLSNEILPLSFKEKSANYCVDNNVQLMAWARKTLNKNTGIALLDVSGGNFNPSHIAELKQELLEKTGYIYLLYPLGLQIILYANTGIADNRENFFCHLDKYNNPKVVLQSITILDGQKKKYYSAVTWGQASNKKFLDAIARGIDNFLENV